VIVPVMAVVTLSCLHCTVSTTRLFGVLKTPNISINRLFLSGWLIICPRVWGRSKKEWKQHLISSILPVG
jgi:hypothetical protein